MKLHEAIDGRLSQFILAQPVFFVGSAPTDVDGHVNVSPKGMTGNFAVLGPHRVAYRDYTGSGAETIAHLRDNGRIVLMFCAFEGPPNIVRLHGRGRAVLPGTPDFAEVVTAFPEPPNRALRAIIDVQVDRVSDSCGYSVPFMDYRGDRDLLDRYWDRKTPEDLVAYHEKKNARSIDGLPAIDPTFADAPR
jgi:hypothetical protein